MPIPFSVPSLALPGKVAIVTGGGTGMGRAMAMEFAKAGADIVIASRTVANLERVAAEARALGRRALAIQTDVSLKTDFELPDQLEDPGGCSARCCSSTAATPRCDQRASAAPVSG
jgi:NAD(P)-dependent dehydrogenase (short-subunit alcohol dehydrogenase family)